jgi:hypothetical protein
MAQRSLKKGGYGLAAAVGALAISRLAPDLARAETTPAHAVSTQPLRPVALKQVVQRNLYAFIPPQCYTKTIDAGGKAHNPCYTCHVGSQLPNFIDDGELQRGYDFAPGARQNRWSNLFVDWGSADRSSTTEEILQYVRQSNYFDAQGGIRLARQLTPPPKAWDQGDDGRWSGFIPDAHFRFDDAGFDRSPDGAYSGWRAYAYYPLPGTFWPTNGSMGDALVRLPAAFRQNEAGVFDAAIYRLNLAIVEALILRQDVLIEPVAEQSVGVDLNRDGRLGVARSIGFLRVGSGREQMSYVGKARLEQGRGSVHLAAGLFPEGTEFLHSVRYLDATDAGVGMAARFKELRYALKAEWWTGDRLEQRAREEAIDKVDSPAEMRALGGNIERGVSNGQGWWYQGFIEDDAGELRPQSFEETAYCVGCHGGVGRGDDGVFSFGRRLGPVTFQRGWFHWTDRGLQGVPDLPIHDGTSTEYVTYLEENGAADEFRQNDEAFAKFFDARGRLRPEMRQRLQRDISELLLPSGERAVALNRAYRALARTQRFTDGRDVVLGGARNVHRQVPIGEKTGVERPVTLGSAKARYARPVAAP